MQMKIGRWEGLYRGYRAQQSISAAVSFAATGKLPVRSDRNGARSLVPLTRVYTVLTQARTGPPRRSESNESVEHIVASGPCLIVNLSAERWSARVHADGSVDGPSNFKAQG